MWRLLWRQTGWMLCLASIAALPAASQNFKTLANFNWKDGANPWYTTLIQGLNGNLVGATYSGGIRNAACDSAYPGCGVVFEVTPAGTITAIHKFNGTDGANPNFGLLLATNGDLYAVAYGGPNKCGTIFNASSSSVLHVFQGTDGCGPNQLTEGADGNFYGTAEAGGPNYPGYTSGTVFRITPGGRLTVLHSFSGTDGHDPWGALVQGVDGALYGTTGQGGGDSYGTIFKITPDSTFTSLYSFCTPNTPNTCETGLFPNGSLVQDPAGSFYGTTSEGGANGCCGTVFKMSEAGEATALHAFCAQNCPDGYYPFAGLVEATDGNFYGTTDEVAGAVDCGTIFRITPGGSFTVLHTFAVTDGCNPHGGLVQGTDGNLYGVTEGGGANGFGTVYSLSVGLGAFVKTLPHAGRVGAPVKILGTNLAGTSSVSFNGVAAAFKVVSPTEIQTTVPTGAGTGKLQVTTPGGTLSSGGPFLVRP